MSEELQRELNKLQHDLLGAVDLIPNPIVRTLARSVVGRLHYVLSLLAKEKNG